MRCSVRNCRNKTKTQGITFHTFPKDTDLRNSWTEALGLSDWEPRERSVVCSVHFQKDAFYQTKCGLKRIRNGAVPIPVSKSCEDWNAPATLKVCRICLSMDVKMYHLSENELGLMYEQVTGVPFTTDDKLPHKLCWECAARLSSANTFRSKALRTHEILMDKLVANGYITIRDVKSISRVRNDLKSSLGEKIHEVNDFNLLINDNVKIEVDNDDDDDYDFDDNGDSNDVKSFEIDIKHETINKISFIDEYPVFDSDDDRTLNEDCKKKRRAKKKRQEDSDDDSPSTIIDRFKKSDVKRKKKTTGLDESLFTITKITYEEQIAEFERRQETTSYKIAPYKCTTCYRGFQSQELYDAHLIKHNEKNGAYECFICKARYTSAPALRNHLTALHTENFSCKECSFVTRSRCVAREHQRWHAGTKYKCKHCLMEFDKPTTLKSHLRLKHVSDFVCELCGYTFINEIGINVHKKKKHRMADENVILDGPYCDVCEVRFVSEEAHSRHLKLSSRHISDGDPNRIRNNSQHFENKRINRLKLKNKLRHVIRPHSSAMNQDSGSPITCEQCGVQLKDQRVYVHHFRRAHPDKNRTINLDKAPFMCEQCGRIYQSAAHLKEHMWVHTGEKTFKCDHCEKTFTNKTNLVHHMGVHSGIRPTYECPICGKNFSYHNNRQRHMLIHTGLKPFKCDMCEKCFTTYGEKRAHVDHVHLKKPWPKRARDRRGDLKMEEPED